MLWRQGWYTRHRKCAGRRAWSVPLNMARTDPSVLSGFTDPSDCRNPAFLPPGAWWSVPCILPSIFNDLVHIAFSSKSACELLEKRDRCLLLLFALWQMRVPWTFTEIIPLALLTVSMIPPWTQTPSGSSTGIRALRRNLRTPSRINKSLP